MGLTNTPIGVWLHRGLAQIEKISPFASGTGHSESAIHVYRNLRENGFRNDLLGITELQIISLLSSYSIDRPNRSMQLAMVLVHSSSQPALFLLLLLQDGDNSRC